MLVGDSECYYRVGGRIGVNMQLHIPLELLINTHDAHTPCPALLLTTA